MQHPNSSTIAQFILSALIRLMSRPEHLISIDAWANLENLPLLDNQQLRPAAKQACKHTPHHAHAVHESCECKIKQSLQVLLPNSRKIRVVINGQFHAREHSSAFDSFIRLRTQAIDIHFAHSERTASNKIKHAHRMYHPIDSRRYVVLPVSSACLLCLTWHAVPSYVLRRL